MRAKLYIVLAFILLTANKYANALQFLLNTVEPWCIDVVPASVTDGITISYTITGMNED